MDKLINDFGYGLFFWQVIILLILIVLLAKFAWKPILSALVAREEGITNALLAALFGTTLAPISGYYGSLAGVVAGFLHMALVMNIGYLHGGMNLYNNGFSGGFTAAILVPIYDAILNLKKEKKA